MRIGIVWLFAMICGLAVLAAVAGCGGGGGGSNLPDPLLRFVNASPDANPLIFRVDSNDDSLQSSALAYQASSADLGFDDDGDVDLRLIDSVGSAELDAIAFTLTRDRKYVVLAKGLQNYGNELLKRLRLVAFQYDKNAPNGTRARLLVIHAFMREAGFDTDNLDFQGGEVGLYDPNNPQFEVENIGFDADNASVKEVDAGVPLIFEARRAGTENVYASSTFTFDAGGIYLALITGIEGQPGALAPQIQYIKLN